VLGTQLLSPFPIPLSPNPREAPPAGCFVTTSAGAKQLLPGQLCRLCHRAVWVKEQAQPPTAHHPTFYPFRPAVVPPTTHFWPLLASRVYHHYVFGGICRLLSTWLCGAARKLAYFCFHVERSRAQQRHWAVNCRANRSRFELCWHLELANPHI